MADQTACVDKIKKIANAELISWNVDSKYSLVDNDFINACNLATDMLELDGITAVSHISKYDNLLYYLSLYLVFRNKIRSSGDYAQSTSGDYVISDYKEKIGDIETSEKRVYGNNVSKKGNYSQSEIDVLASIADLYKKKYDDLILKSEKIDYTLGSSFYDADTD